MKKLSIILLGVGLCLGLTSPATVLAKKYKPPKSVCYDLNEKVTSGIYEGGELILATKKQGTKTKDSTGNIFYYTINGAIKSSESTWANIDGNGYIDNNESPECFEGNISALVNKESLNCNLFIYRDTVVPTLWCGITNESGYQYIGFDLNEKDCSTTTLD